MSVQQDFLKDNNPISLKPLQKAVPSSAPSRNSGGTADVLPAERKRATFDVIKLTNLMDGGEGGTAKRHFILSPSEDTDVSDKYYWERPAQLKHHLDHYISVHQKFKNYIPTREEVGWMSEYSMMSGSMMNHSGLFLPTIMSQGSNEQFEWALKALSMQIIGCYAQTELGHGSNVRGLQTTAEYDKVKQEFVLNTPTLTSMKWWPGTLGKVANFAAVYAQLILEGKEYGVHVFLVQIRDANHRPLPGIELGDLGPKLGDHSNDTGFMRMENVRIPRERMLCRYQQVSPEGQYIKAPEKTSDKMHYATMMFTRGFMVKSSGGMLARAVTIATRYSCVRRQGFMDTKAGVSYETKERAIIDYQMQRYRIFKQLALTYSIKFTGKWMTDKFKEVENNVGKKGSEMAGRGAITDAAALPEIAATSAGLKAFCTWLTSEGIEDCRKCCGGNGYLLNSGIAALAADYVWQTTAEGDWIVLMLQTARYLVNRLKNARAGQTVSGPCEYMQVFSQKGFDVRSAAPPRPKSVEHLNDLTYLQALFSYRAMILVSSVADALQAKLDKKDGVSTDDVWNHYAVQLCDAVKAHCGLFMLTKFAQTVSTVEDPALKQVMHQLCAVFALTTIHDDNWAGLDLFGPTEFKYVSDALTELMEKLRPNAVALVDAFDIPDRVLNSTLGRYDGNVYEALVEAAKKSSLNQQDPFLGYDTIVKPILDKDSLTPANGIQSKL